MKCLKKLMFKHILAVLALMVLHLAINAGLDNNNHIDSCDIQLDANQYPNLAKAQFDNKSFKEVWDSCALTKSGNKDSLNRTIAIEKVIEQYAHKPEFVAILAEVKKLTDGTAQADFIKRRIDHNTILDTPLENQNNFLNQWLSAQNQGEKSQAVDSLLATMGNLLGQNVEPKKITSEGGEVDYARNNRIVRYLKDLYYFLKNNEPKLDEYSQKWAKLKDLANQAKEYLFGRQDSKQALQHLDELNSNL